MSDKTVSQSAPENDARGDRKFSVSSNRGQACHKVRYVEAGGAAVDTEECVFCDSVPVLSDGASAPKEKPKGEEKEQ